MTLRQLWWMAQGRLEHSRGLLVSQRGAIATLFSKTISIDGEQFLQYGIPDGGIKEPKLDGVDEKVAEMLRTGKVAFE